MALNPHTCSICGVYSLHPHPEIPIDSNVIRRTWDVPAWSKDQWQTTRGLTAYICSDCFQKYFEAIPVAHRNKKGNSAPLFE